MITSILAVLLSFILGLPDELPPPPPRTVQLNQLPEGDYRVCDAGTHPVLCSFAWGG